MPSKINCYIHNCNRFSILWNLWAVNFLLLLLTELLYHVQINKCCFLRSPFSQKQKHIFSALAHLACSVINVAKGILRTLWGKKQKHYTFSTTSWILNVWGHKCITDSSEKYYVAISLILWYYHGNITVTHLLCFLCGLFSEYLFSEVLPLSQPLDLFNSIKL